MKKNSLGNICERSLDGSVRKREDYSGRYICSACGSFVSSAMADKTIGATNLCENCSIDNVRKRVGLPPRKIQKDKPCLKCGDLRLSIGINDRLCDKCHRSNLGIVDEK